MIRKHYQLAHWCDAAIHRRTCWVTLVIHVLLLAFGLLLGIIQLVLPPMLLADTTLLLYILHRHHAFSNVYQRKPRPKDAQCETILIDASLIGQGTRVRAASQPVDVADSITLRLGSGALLLGAAMVHTADTLPRTDRAALLSAVQGLNLKPSRLRSHSPVLRQETQGETTVVTVQDGMTERRYYLGQPWKLAGICQSIWENDTRPMSDHDRLRIADTAQYIAQGNCRVLAFATAATNEEPIFLGMCGLGEEVHISALSDVAGLRGMGLTIMLDPGIQPDTDLDTLRTLMELPDHHARPDIHMAPREISDPKALGITRRFGDSLLEPVTALRQSFSQIESTLRRYATMLLLPTLFAMLMGGWSAALVNTALLLYTAIFLGVDLSRPSLRRRTLILLALAGLLAKAFLVSQPADLAFMGGGIITGLTGLGCAVRLCGSSWRLTGSSWRTTVPVLAAAVIYALLMGLIHLSAGIAMVLPLAFSMLLAAICLLMLLMEQRLFR